MPSNRAHQEPMIQRLKGKHDTLPITRTFRKRCALYATGTRLKATSLQ
jgi:hypothetical protein